MGTPDDGREGRWVDPKRERRRVCLALVHHANQSNVTDGYADREGIGEILGLGGNGGQAADRRGLLPLLQLHLDYGIPLNLHLSGTLMETLAWHYPEGFSIIKRLARAGLLEVVGSAFSQNVMPFFSAEYNLRQLNEELWLYRRHLGRDVRAVKTFWVPERVWDTAKLAGVLRSDRLLNGGYRYVLLDDRLVYAAGDDYLGSERERFDREGALRLDAFRPWEIEGGQGLLMLPISKHLRYLIPPAAPESLDRLSEVCDWLASSGDDRAVAVYGDDLEKAAGVGSWDKHNLERYEQFLRWLSDREWVRPVLVSEWAEVGAAAGVREIERGTFYELAQSWHAGEDYRGWHEDPNCHAHRQYLSGAEQALLAAAQGGAEPGLLEAGWKHLLHCSYETSWHDFDYSRQSSGHGGEAGPQKAYIKLAPWAAALTSHARSCQIITAAAEWFKQRDGIAHAELADLDLDGEQELVLKNDRLFAVVSPLRGGRLTFLFDLTGPSGRLVIGNVSDDWNWQEELNRYMDCPRNHPGALAEVGHEHDRYQAVIAQGRGTVAQVSLRNIEPNSSLHATEKQLRLSAEASHLCVRYLAPATVWRLSTEVCLSPHYYRLLRCGRQRVAPFNGRDWRGWSNGPSRVWMRIDRQQSTIWDRPYQSECGHGLNLRVTSFSRDLHLEIGVGRPPRELCHTRANRDKLSFEEKHLHTKSK